MAIFTAFLYIQAPAITTHQSCWDPPPPRAGPAGRPPGLCPQSLLAGPHPALQPLCPRPACPLALPTLPAHLGQCRSPCPPLVPRPLPLHLSCLPELAGSVHRPPCSHPLTHHAANRDLPPRQPSVPPSPSDVRGPLYLALGHCLQNVPPPHTHQASGNPLPPCPR